MGSKLVIRTFAPLLLALFLWRGHAFQRPTSFVGADLRLAQSVPINTDVQGGVQHRPDAAETPGEYGGSNKSPTRSMQLIRRGAPKAPAGTSKNPAAAKDDKTKNKNN